MALFVEGLGSWDIRQRAQVMARVQLEAGLDVEAHLFPGICLSSLCAAALPNTSDSMESGWRHIWEASEEKEDFKSGRGEKPVSY